MSKIAVIYYSATGHVHKLAEAVAKGASDGGAEVRVRRVAELASEEVIRSQDAWHEHYLATVDVVAEATLDDLEWADGFALGSPTRFGLPASQLKQFIDQTGPLWVQGHLSNKVATSFTSSMHAHGGQESTLLRPGSTMPRSAPRPWPRLTTRDILSPSTPASWWPDPPAPLTDETGGRARRTDSPLAPYDPPAHHVTDRS